jgi:hypothetical protein
VRLVDRLRPSVGEQVTLRLPGLGIFEGTLSSVGADWLLAADIAGREALVPLSAVLTVGGLLSLTAVPRSEGVVASRLGFGYALRGVARDRSPVALHLTDGVALAGTLDRVGNDFVELADHPAGEPRRQDRVRALVTVPMSAIAALRTG